MDWIKEAEDTGLRTGSRFDCQMPTTKLRHGVILSYETTHRFSFICQAGTAFTPPQIVLVHDPFSSCVGR